MHKKTGGSPETYCNIFRHGLRANSCLATRYRPPARSFLRGVSVENSGRLQHRDVSNQGLLLHLPRSDRFNAARSLAVMDDTPRREFSPRQRHTLKEFAVRLSKVVKLGVTLMTSLQQVAMRELELWKDKIQLRIRDRIQSSMEQFTRECLEVDKHANEENSEIRQPGSTSMEQIYVHAVKLVKRTLDVEGAIVMDVSHIDVLETVGAESSMSLTLHDADGGTESQSRSLSKEQHRKLVEYFESYPEGKICEGIAHASLRPFLPARIQYVLGEWVRAKVTAISRAAVDWPR